jgi:hypothetical protein
VRTTLKRAPALKHQELSQRCPCDWRGRRRDRRCERCRDL